MSSKCYKHPHQLIVGICASCLREQLAIFVNLEQEEGQGDREENDGDYADYDGTHHGHQQASCMESFSLHVSACEDISNRIDADCNSPHVSACEGISHRIHADRNVPCLHSLDSTRATDGEGPRACPIESTQEAATCIQQLNPATHVLNLTKEEEGSCVGSSPHCFNLTREEEMPVAFASLDFGKEHNGVSSSSNVSARSSHRLNLTSNEVTCTGSSQPPLSFIEEEESSVGSAPHGFYLMERRYQVVNYNHSSVASQNLIAGCNPTTQQNIDELDIRGSRLECPLMVRRSLSFREDAKLRLDAGKNTRSEDNRTKKKKTLSYLFNLDKAESEAQCLKDNTNQDFVVQSPLSVSSTASTFPSTFTEKKCGSSSMRNKQNSLIDTGHSTTPLSWFASLFRRRTKDRRPRCLRQKSVSLLDCHALEDGKLSWEAPRPSAWEQLRFTSAWEGPRSSWQGVTVASDGDSVRSCFDYFQDSLSEVRQDADLELDPEMEGYDFAMNAGNCEHSKKRNAKRSVASQAMSGMQTSDQKMFVMAKALQLQRDVSTQTTPPRAFQSDTDGVVMKQQRSPKCQDNLHQVPFWSKPWIRTLTNSIKQKKITSTEFAGIAMDDASEQASTVSAFSAREDSCNLSQYNRSGGTCSHSQQSGSNINSGYRAWDAYYNSGSQKGFNGVKGPQSLKGFASRRKNGGSNRKRSSSLSPLSSDNGLLRFYLTPVRSTSGTRCSMKPKNHG